MSKDLIPIKFKRLVSHAIIPQYGSAEAACFDLTVSSIEFIDVGKVIVHFGFATEIPPGYKVIVVPRSSFTHKDWVLQNSPAQIDSDYRGEWMLKFQTLKEGAEFPYHTGERIAQGAVEKVKRAEWIEVFELNNTQRGTGGYGSTGR